MEREPEEDSYSEHGEQGIHALFDLACHAGFFFGGVADALLLGFLLSGRRKTVLGAYIKMVSEMSMAATEAKNE